MKSTKFYRPKRFRSPTMMLLAFVSSVGPASVAFAGENFGATLGPYIRLQVGDWMSSLNGRYIAKLYPDGNFKIEEVRAGANRIVREFGKDPNPPSPTFSRYYVFNDLGLTVLRETDTNDDMNYGSAVVVSAASCAWSSIHLTDEGALQCVSDDRVLWNLGRNRGSYLDHNQRLEENDWLSSPNGRFMAKLYPNGRFKIEETRGAGRLFRTVQVVGEDLAPDSTETEYYLANSLGPKLQLYRRSRRTPSASGTLVWESADAEASAQRKNATGSCRFYLNDAGALQCTPLGDGGGGDLVFGSRLRQ